MSRNNLRSGLTLIELIMASVVSLIIILTVAVVLVAGQRNWQDIYNQANTGLRVDAIDSMLRFGVVARHSNKNNYRIYEVNGNSFVRALPPVSQPVSEVSGQAVEFRYWDDELKAEFMDESKSAVCYALFYQDDDMLKVDYGPYPTGGVDGTSRNDGAGVRTTVLANNVDTVQFSHTTKNKDGDGNGCVKMVLTLEDQTRDRKLTVKTAALMRNVWP